MPISREALRRALQAYSDIVQDELLSQLEAACSRHLNAGRTEAEALAEALYEVGPFSGVRPDPKPVGSLIALLVTTGLFLFLIIAIVRPARSVFDQMPIRELPDLTERVLQLGELLTVWWPIPAIACCLFEGWVWYKWNRFAPAQRRHMRLMLSLLLALFLLIFCLAAMGIASPFQFHQAH